MIHCCKLLETFLDDPRLDIQYNEVLRRYYMHVSGGSATQGLLYCPWCGKKFPSDLVDEYYDTLWEMFGEDVDIADLDLPEEFKTSSWWVSRGL